MTPTEEGSISERRLESSTATNPAVELLSPLLRRLRLATAAQRAILSLNHRPGSNDRHWRI